jgi:hypothetical protein
VDLEAAAAGDETIYHVAARHAKAIPQAFAVRDRHRRLNYAELVAAPNRLAAHLTGHDIRPSNRVAVWLPSRVETAIALLACSRNGYVCCPSLHRDHTVGDVVRANPLRFSRASSASSSTLCGTKDRSLPGLCCWSRSGTTPLIRKPMLSMFKSAACGAKSTKISRHSCSIRCEVSGI